MTNLKALAEAYAMKPGRPLRTCRDAYLAGARAALELPEVVAMREACADMLESHKNLYLCAFSHHGRSPEDDIVRVDFKVALANFDALKESK